MLILILLLYFVPVYLVFFKYKAVPLNLMWKIILPLPPIAFLIFLWITFGRYTPTTQDAYVQAPVVQVAPQVNGVVTKVLAADNEFVRAGTTLFEIDPRPFQYASDQAQARLAEARQNIAGVLASVASGEDAVHRAESNLKSAQFAVTAAESDLTAAREQIASNQSQVKLADTDLQRNTQLIKARTISQQEFDQSARNAEIKRADLAAAESRLGRSAAALEQARAQQLAAQSAIGEAVAARNKALVQVDPVQAVKEAIKFRDLGTTGSDSISAPSAVESYLQGRDDLVQSVISEADNASKFLAKTTAAVRQAEEALNQARFNLESATVRAPMDGIVSNLQLTTGTYARAGGPVVSLIGTNQWQLVANFPENWMRKITPGDKAIFSLRNDPNHVRDTTVKQVGRGVISGQGIANGVLMDPSPRLGRQTATPELETRFPVILTLRDDDPSTVLRVGATGRVTIFASGGYPVTSTLALVLHHIGSFMDIFYPKLPVALVLLAVAGGIYFIRRRKQTSN